MSENNGRFILKHTFKMGGINWSPTETHFSMNWIFCVDEKLPNLTLHLLCVSRTDQKNESMSILLEMTMTSIDGTETIQKSVKSDGKEYVRVFIEYWDKIREKYLRDDEFTVQLQVEVINNQRNSSVEKLKEKVERDKPKLVLRYATGHIKHESMKRGDVTVHSGVPWYLSLTRPGPAHGKYPLVIVLNCNRKHESNLWAIEVKCEASIKFVTGEKKIYEKKERTMVFNRDTTRSRLCSVAYSSGSRVPGFKIIVEVSVTINQMVGFFPEKQLNFRKEDPTLTDVCLVVDGKKFYASKMMLAQCSSFFEDLFFQSDVQNDEIEIEDASPATFEVFLSIIYWCDSNITTGNVEKLLNLANRYDVPRVFRKCQQFLIDSEDVGVQKKLEMTSEFCLADLQNNALNSIEKVEDVRELRDKMQQMSVETANVLLPKLLTYVP